MNASRLWHRDDALGGLFHRRYDWAPLPLLIAFAPFYQYIQRGKYRLWSVPTVTPPQQRNIQQVLAEATGRFVSSIHPISLRVVLRQDLPEEGRRRQNREEDAAAMLQRSIRRVYWADVEEHLERDFLPPSFRVGYDTNRWRCAVQTSVTIPLDTVCMNMWGAALRHVGAPGDTILADGISYPLIDYLLFQMCGYPLFQALDQYRERELWRRTRILGSLCRLLSRCIPIGESADDPGTWIVAFA